MKRNINRVEMRRMRERSWWEEAICQSTVMMESGGLLPSLLFIRYFLFFFFRVTFILFVSLSLTAMAVANLYHSYINTQLHSHTSHLSSLSTHLSFCRRNSLHPLPRTQNSMNPAAVQTQDLKIKSECYRVFCIAYDLKAVSMIFDFFFYING